MPYGPFFAKGRRSFNGPTPSGVIQPNQTWAGGNNSLSGVDNNYSSSQGMFQSWSSMYLYASGFGFNIPTTWLGGANEVRGVILDLYHYQDTSASNDAGVYDYNLYFGSGVTASNSGLLIGNNLAVPFPWPSGTVTHRGHGSDSVTLSLPGDNISLFNSNDFGVAWQIKDLSTTGQGPIAKVDAVSITLYTLDIDGPAVTGAVAISGGIPLFISGFESVSGNIPLFITGISGTQTANFPLFINSHENVSGGFPLIINAFSNVSGGIPLYTQSADFSSGNIPLFTHGLDNISGNIPLYTDGFSNISGNIPLFLNGAPFIFTCYPEVYPNTVNTICGSGQTAWVNLQYIQNSDNTRATCTFTSGGAASCQINAFFGISGISVSGDISSIMFNFYKQQNVGDDSVIDLQVFLIESGIIQSGVNYAQGIWGINDNNVVNYIITQDQNGNALKVSDIMASGFGVAVTAGTNNFGAGIAQIDAITCTVCANVPGFGTSIPLFLSCAQGISGGIPLFVNPSLGMSGNIPLFMEGFNNISGGIPLYVNTFDAVSGGIPLYLGCASFESGNIPLYIAGHLTTSGGITLYLQGDPTYPLNNNLPLYLANYSSSGGLDSLQRKFPLFLDSHDFAQGITLYMGVSNIGTPDGNITLYTKGENLSINGGIPLFLNNSGLTNKIPLYVKGLSYGTNPYINSDGYYPFEGGITLFLKSWPGGGIPLYIGSNYGESGGVPLYLAANPQISGSLPLFMATSVAQTKNIPLYHHGF